MVDVPHPVDLFAAGFVVIWVPTDFILSVHTEAELLQLQRNFCSTLIIAASGSKKGKAAVANRRYALSSSAYHFQQAFQLPLWQV